MRNSGDLTQVDDLYKGCLFEATRLAQLLSLAFTNESFSLPQAQLEAEYLSRFERICNEVTESRLN